MFRIAFEPRGGFFKIQFSRLYGLFWQDVTEPSGTVGKRGAHEVKRFPAYNEARKWVQQIGLGDGFDEQSTKGHPFANGMQQHPYVMLQPVIPQPAGREGRG